LLLRSPVVTGRTNLGVEAYTQVVPTSDGDVPKEYPDKTFALRSCW